jgi:type IV pilus assembly protein PilO
VKGAIVLDKIINRTQPRFIYGAMAAMLVLVVLLSYLYLLKKPLAEYGQMKERRILLQATVASGAQLANDISDSRRQVDALTQRLTGKSLLLPINQMIAHTIDRLDSISSRHAIQLISVTPDKAQTTNIFEEIPFTIEVRGNYQGLVDWLRRVEQDLAPMVVNHFEISSQTGPDLLTMRLKMVSYRMPLEEI